MIQWQKGAKPVSDDEPTQAMQRYIAEIDRFATLLRDQQQLIDQLGREEVAAKAAYDEAKAATREAKEVEHNTVSLLLKFIRPGSIEVLPLFDQMAPAKESLHGAGAKEWRKEPISELKLSAAAARALIDADIVLVGQLQDRILQGDEWFKELGITEGMAQAMEAKLHAFIEERSSK